MTERDVDVTTLEPVRAALLARARAESAAILAAADATAAERVARARAEGERIRAAARARGTVEATALLAADRARARQEARGLVLAARREAYEALRAAAREAATRLRDEPGYPELREHLVAEARRVLGQRACIREAPSGGVIGEVPGRRIDLSLAGLADRAAEDCRAELEREPWPGT